MVTRIFDIRPNVWKCVKIYTFLSSDNVETNRWGQTYEDILLSEGILSADIIKGKGKLSRRWQVYGRGANLSFPKPVEIYTPESCLAAMNTQSRGQYV